MFLEMGSHSRFFQGWGGLVINLFYRRRGSICMDIRFTFVFVFVVVVMDV